MSIFKRKPKEPQWMGEDAGQWRVSCGTGGEHYHYYRKWANEPGFIQAALEKLAVVGVIGGIALGIAWCNLPYFPKGFETSYENQGRLKKVTGLYSGRREVIKHAPTRNNPQGIYAVHPINWGSEGRRTDEDFYLKPDLQRVCAETDIAPKDGKISDAEVKAEEARVFARFARPASETNW